MQLMTIPHVELAPIESVSPGMLRRVVDWERYRALSASIVHARHLLRGRIVWNISTTARGGGVAEMLRSTGAYISGAGIDSRWLVVHGNGDCFRIGKRIHNQLQGFEGDGGELGARAHEKYARCLAPVAVELISIVRPGDLVVLHGPQTAGLIPELRNTGANIIWRCHVDVGRLNKRAQKACAFLMRYIGGADAYVFPRPNAAWKDLPQARIAIIPPAIDPLSTKNNLMSRAQAAAVLISGGIMSGYSAAIPYFVRPSGTMGLVSRRAELVQLEPVLPRTRLVLQVSRWDRLKDPVGVIQGFATLVPPQSQAHLVLAGPEVTAVADDPEAVDVFDRTVVAWESLPEPARRRVHLVCLSMRDCDESAAVVNALQRWAEVVVQKSLAEGFGLAVGEAMWKARPVVASRVGGVQDQIEHGRSGFLLDDPTDLDAFARAVTDLLDHPESAQRIGLAAVQRIADHFFIDRHLRQYADLVSRLFA